MFGARRFIDDLLRQRRRRRARVDPASDAELRTAILLRSARLGADSVREDFVSDLHQRLARELDEQPAPTPIVRRRLIAGLGATAAASAVVGAGIEHVLLPGGQASREAGGPPSERQLDPDSGVWTTVVASVDLPEGSSVHFDLGAITGFVSRGNGRVWAVSGVCTHLGCRLNLDAPARKLDCPCHGASFAVTGAVLRHRLPIQLAPLPEIAAREINGAVQVFAPPREGN